jgi:acyl carrier protein
VSREEVEREIVRLLREHVLLGSDREVVLNSPIGPAVGLDSLGLMEFLAALEERFEVEFPDTLWSDRRQFTVRRLAEYLVAVDEKVAGERT